MGNSASDMPVPGKAGVPATSIFDFEVENTNKELVPLSNFKGKKVYYIVNVATQ